MSKMTFTWKFPFTSCMSSFSFFCILFFLLTVNIDIFGCIYFREFMKTVNFACMEIRVLRTTGSLGYYKTIIKVSMCIYFRRY